MNFTLPMLMKMWRNWNPYALLVGIMQLLWKTVQADLILLRFTDTESFFLKVEGLWQPCIVR